MDPRQQYLLQQNAALRKENRTFKEEFRSLNALISEKEDETKGYRDRIFALRQEITELHEEISVLQEVQAENVRLTRENDRLAMENQTQRNNCSVTSRKHYQDFGKTSRCRVRAQLSEHFKKCLQSINDWEIARITIIFNAENPKLFWQERYVNIATDLKLESDARVDVRWDPAQICNIVYATDKFMVSNESYHEIQMNAEKGLPSSHAFKKVKNGMSDSVNIETSNNPEVDSARRSIEELLIYAQVPKSKRRKYFLRFSCDGSVVARDRFAVAGTIKVFDCNKEGKPKEFKEAFHLRDEIPIFYLYGEEDEATLRSEAAESFKELMDLKEKGIVIEGVHHEVEILMTCDWKCLSTIMGVNPPTCKFFCIMCDSTYDERYQFTENDLGKWKIIRGSAHRQQCMASGHPTGYTHEPLLDIDFEHCPFDHLHLCKGVISKQFNQVVRWVVDQGNQDRLLHEMKRLKVPFDFYTVKSNDDSDRGSVVKWTNPPVKELKKIYSEMVIANVLDPVIDKSKKAPENMKVWQLKEYCLRNDLSAKGRKPELIARLKAKLGLDIKLTELRKVGDIIQDVEETDIGSNVRIDVDGLQKLWHEGNKLLQQVKDGVDNVDVLQEDLLQWGVNFMKYTIPEDVSPYIHALVFHCPEFVRRYGGLGAFEMEEVERLNRVFRSCFYRKTHQGREPLRTAYMIMRYWNRVLTARVYQYSREKVRSKFFNSKKRKMYNANETSSSEDIDQDLEEPQVYF